MASGKTKASDASECQPRKSEQIHIDLEDDDEDDLVNQGQSITSRSRSTYEFNDFDAHINTKENSELRKPKATDDNKDLEIRSLKQQIFDL